MDHRARPPTPLKVVSSKESRTELLAWLNGVLSHVTIAGGHTVPRVQKVEQCCNGVPYVLLLPSLLPTAYPPLTAKAKIPARHEFESVVNFKLFADALQKNSISRPDVLSDEVDKVIKGAYQANLQLLQWFRGLYNVLSRTQEDRMCDDRSKQTSDVDVNETYSSFENRKPPSDSVDTGVDAAAAHIVKERPRTTSGDHASGVVAAPTDPAAGNQKGDASPSAPTAGKTTAPGDVEGPGAARKRPQSSASPATRDGPSARRAPATAGARIPSETPRSAPRTASPKVRPTPSVLSSLRGSLVNGVRGAVAKKHGVMSASRTGSSEPNSTRLNGRGSSPGVAMTPNNSTSGTALHRRGSGGARPSVDCSSADGNGSVLGPGAGRQRMAAQRRPLVSPHRSAPTGLFQTQSTKTLPSPVSEPRGVKQKGRSDSLLASMAMISVRNERQFFYDKLRQIEILVAPLVEKKDVGDETMKLAQSVLDILYSTK